MFRGFGNEMRKRDEKKKKKRSEKKKEKSLFINARNKIKSSKMKLDELGCLQIVLFIKIYFMLDRHSNENREVSTATLAW